MKKKTFFMYKNGLAYRVRKDLVEGVADVVHRGDGQAGGVSGDKDLRPIESSSGAVASTWNQETVSYSIDLSDFLQ